MQKIFFSFSAILKQYVHLHIMQKDQQQECKQVVLVFRVANGIWRRDSRFSETEHY